MQFKNFTKNIQKLLEIHSKVFYNAHCAVLEKLAIRCLNPHCRRHTFFTLMADAEIQPAVITGTDWHENYSTTMPYTHIKLDKKLEAVNKL